MAGNLATSRDSVDRGFVGRERELAELEAALDEAIGGRGKIYLLAGEPGIGKTRLADEIGERAAAREFRVLWGRCWDGGDSPAKWPWIQILRSLVRATDPIALRAQMGAGAPYLSQLVADVRQTDDTEPPATSFPLEPERARFYLFDAVTTFLKQAAASGPLLLVLDDFHASDTSSLRLLQFVARELRDARILVVVTYRDAEAKARGPAGEVLADLAREGQTLYLKGLSEPDVARLIEQTAGAVASAELVGAIYRATGGNPFFVDGIVRVALADHESLPGAEALGAGDLHIPEEVKESVRQRLRLLSDDARELLTVAALLGETLDRAILGAALGWPDERGLAALADAVRAGILVKASTVHERYRFSHALVGETLRGDVGPARAAALHRRIGEALESVYGTESSDHLSQLADHFFEGIAGGDAERAIEYAVRSARQAAAGFAWEETIRQYERALVALQRISANDPRRLHILLELGDAQWRTGDGATAKDTCLRAVALARRSGAAMELARGALGFCGEFAPVVNYDDARACLLEEALAALGDAAPALRARVLARLSRELRYTTDIDRGLAYADEAVRVARGSGDRATLVATLTEWHILATAAGRAAEDRRARADEILHLAQESGTPDLLAWARMRRISDALERGELADLAHELHAYSSLAQQIRHRDHIWFATVAQTYIALVTGRFDDAERLMTEALALGQHQPRITVFGSYWLQLFMLRRDQGRLAELEPLLARRPSNPLVSFVWPSTLALFHSELGREADARSEFEELAANGFLDVPKASMWPIAIGNLAEVCAVVGDASRAALLYDLLLPHAGRSLARGTAWSALYSADHYLGLLAATMSKRAAAAHHFEAALAFHTRMGARPLLARARVDYANTLLRLGSSADRGRAKDLLERAVAVARTLGMRSLLEKAQALERDLSAASTEAGHGTFRCEGDFWRIAHHGPAFAVKDMKGLHCIARLLREPGREIHCLELVAEDAGPCDQADRLSELARAAGLGSEGAEAERAVQRARVNVSRTIKDAIAKIRDYDRGLARHLANAIRTGVLCSYTPEPGTERTWTF